MAVEIHQAECLAFLREMLAQSVDLIYVDPPFNTGKTQRLRSLRTSKAEEGDRTGFGGKRYGSEVVSDMAYADRFDDYIEWLAERMAEARRVLKPTGSLFVHLDWREAHYAKVMLDGLFGRESFINEIIWAYDYGGRSKSKWSAKHDTILWYAKDPDGYTFQFEEMDRIPYMAPGLVGAEKAKKGKTPTDVWWHTIVSPTGKEKSGYPTQKPLGILRRIIAVHSQVGETVLDFFAGSGTTGEAARELGRNAILVDENPEAIAVMRRRLGAE